MGIIAILANLERMIHNHEVAGGTLKWRDV